MISVDDAQKIILNSIAVRKGTEKIRFSDSYGRIIAQDLISELNVPQIDNSAMDGYALISSDVEGASPEKPVILEIKGEVQAGGNNVSQPVKSGSAIRIMTGAHLPHGADAVIPFEDTEECGDRVKIFTPVNKSDNVRFAGEDIAAGDTILVRGTYIDSSQIGLIASVNRTDVTVFNRPEVSIISTGDEIIEPGSADIYGKTVNSNAYVLMNEVKKTGGNPSYFGIVKDRFDEIRATVEKALAGDIVLCTGGVSMGRYDFIPDVLKSLGAEILVHKIAVKPGKPVLFSKVQDKLFFGLPGNPVSVMVSFIEFVRPAILKMAGAIQYEKPVVKAVLKETIRKQAGRRHFIRGIFTIADGVFNVSTTGNQRSDIMHSMAAANCLIIIPENVETVEKNSIVNIQLIKHGEISVEG
ncbi:MAG TPA: molybdopterin molybdotransferase MoeA [Spirochaetota bacterium]|nr:molybdopterin molybdotransferase MoeA [Spirochaetota bacterium]